MAPGDNRSVLQGSIPAEIERFDALAGRWWDPHGPMRPLHAMNPVRVGWIARHLAGPGTVLDVGCGAGLAAEALARRGHTVLGIDAAPQVLEAARAHAAQSDLAIEYRDASLAELAEEGRRFDVVTALEVIEHVADPAALLAGIAAVLKPGGWAFLSTLNRTARAFVMAKLGAEYVMRLLPPGTHDWRRFVTPAELARYGRVAGLRLADSAGLNYNPLQGAWQTGPDLAVNYITAFVR